MNLVRWESHALKYVLICFLDKWLGKDTVPCLTLDGKGTKAEIVERVQRWALATGRNVTLPGKPISPYEISILLC